MRYKSIRAAFLLLLLIFCTLAQGFKMHPLSAAEIPQISADTVSLEIDPVRNVLMVSSNGKPFKKFRIALGKPETPTPVGQWKVINKYKNWGDGFGTRWIGLNVPWGLYGIHGTNRPSSIGHDASHGCIRMLNRDVEELYEWVKIGTPVLILGHALGDADRDTRRIAKGDSGADVLLVQNRLRAAGYFNGECNGRFSSSTEIALKKFEQSHGLPVDGVVSLHDYQSMGLIE